MQQRMYLVDDKLFVDEEGKFNSKHRAIAYAKSNDIDESNVLEVRSDVELDYLKHLKEKNVWSLSTHDKVLVFQGYENSKGQFIPALVEDIPFHYVDDEGVHYEWVVGSVYDLNIKLIYAKTLFDQSFKKENYYLKLLYPEMDGTYNELKLADINTLRDKFRKQEHTKMLKKLADLREKQLYDRLLKLREEGRITEKQTKTLYRLEEHYGQAG